MNMLSSRYKKTLLISIGLFSLVIICLVIWFFLLEVESPFDDGVNPDDPDINRPDRGNRNPYEGISIKRKYIIDDTIVIEQPEEQLDNGIVRGIHTEGLNRYMSIEVDGELVTFAVTDKTIFHKVNEGIVSSRELNDGDNVSVITLDTNSTPVSDGVSSILTVIVGDSSNIHYVPMITMERTADYLYVVNPERNVRYKIKRDSVIVDGVTGLQLSDMDILQGDRLFIHEGEPLKYEDPYIYEKTDGVAPPNIINKNKRKGNAEVYPQVYEEDLLSNAMDTVSAEKVYVYTYKQWR